MNKNFQRKIVNIFLPINFNICFGCSKEPSHWDGSFGYPQHMFWLKIRKLFFCYTLLTKVLCLHTLFKINFSIKILPGTLSKCQTVWIQIRLTFCWSWSGSKLLAKVISRHTIVLCMLGDFHALHDDCWHFSKNSFMNTVRVWNCLDPDQDWCCVGPDLGPSCLQRLLADIPLTLCMLVIFSSKFNFSNLFLQEHFQGVNLLSNVLNQDLFGSKLIDKVIIRQ